MGMQKYLSIHEAARLLHVTPLTLRNWDRDGKLRAYRNPINNYRIYRLDQIELFLRNLELSRAKKASRKIDVF